MRLLAEHHTAIAPGTAFATGFDLNPSLQEMLGSICRVSLANDEETICAGIHSICDLLDQL